MTNADNTLEQNLLERVEKVTEAVIVQNNKLDNCYNFLVKLGLNEADVGLIFKGIDDVDFNLLETKILNGYKLSENK